MSTPAARPRAPSRVQPKRQGKEVVYDFGDRPVTDERKRSRTVHFETSKTARAPARKLVSQGAIRRELAKQVAEREIIEQEKMQKLAVIRACAELSFW